MADPLSIASAVVGLLAATGKVYGVLSDFVVSTSNAPQSVEATLQAVEEIEIVLSSVQSMIESVDSLPADRKRLIQLDHLSILLTNSVFTLSKLESLVCQKDGFRYRFLWAWNEKKVLSLLPRLESQKTSLALMASVLQSKSTVDAQHCYNAMLVKMDEILEQNKTLGQHLHWMESGGPLDAQSVKFIDDASSIFSSRPRSLRSIASGPFSGRRALSIVKSKRLSLSLREFEIALGQSRVYSRTRSDKCDVSYTTSTAPTNAWSMLSGLSLNDISIVSAFRLPITLNDIRTIVPGSTFSNAIVERPALEDRWDTYTPNRIGYTWRLVNQQNISRLRKALVAQMPRDHLARRQRDSDAPLPKIKLVMVGDANCLKGKLIRTFMKKPSKAFDYISAGPDDFKSTVRVGNFLVNLEVRDTTGLEDYPKLRPFMYTGADAFIVLARKLGSSPFESAETLWIPEILGRHPDVPYFVVGTHDKAPYETTSGLAAVSNRGVEFAESSGAVKYFDCDATDRDSVSAVLGQIITVVKRLNILRNRHKPDLPVMEPLAEVPEQERQIFVEQPATAATRA